MPYSLQNGTEIERLQFDSQPLPFRPLCLPQDNPLELEDDATLEISRAQEAIIYSDIWEDMIDFESEGLSVKMIVQFRLVELPFSICKLVPLRNFTEREWRSLGVVMRPGWENFGRRSGEYNILMFRRFPDSIPREFISLFRKKQVKSGRILLQSVSDAFLFDYLKIFCYPVWAFEALPCECSAFLRKLIAEFEKSSRDLRFFAQAVFDFCESRLSC